MFTEGLGAELHTTFWGFRAGEDLAPRSPRASGGNECGGVGVGVNN